MRQRKTRVTAGDLLTLTLPFSEACVHLGVAGATLSARVLESGVQIIDRDGRPFSFPITHGEAAVYTDRDGLYLATGQHAAVKLCATVGCGHAATRAVRLNTADSLGPWIDHTCTECADGYLRRPHYRPMDVTSTHACAAGHVRSSCYPADIDAPDVDTWEMHPA